MDRDHRPFRQNLEFLRGNDRCNLYHTIRIWISEDPENVDFILEYAASKQALFNLQLERETTFTPSLEANMLAAIKAAEDAVAAVPGEPAMLDALSVVMNMSALSHPGK